MFELNGQSCPFCGGSNFRRYSANAYDAVGSKVNVIECRACVAAWQWPLQRSQEDSARTFACAYEEKVEGTYFDPVKRDAIAEMQRNFLVNLIGSPGRLLDIGCGDGYFARHMANHGWRVVGLDPAINSSISETTTTGSLTLQAADLGAMADDEMFDVMTLWDVIEHVEAPDGLIALAARHLVHGGVLVVETGNYQSEGRAFHEDVWWNYQLDHRWYLAPPQLKTLMIKNGLPNTELLKFVMRPWWKGQSDMSEPRVRSLVKAAILNPRKLASTWQQFKERQKIRQKWQGWSGLEIMTMLGRKP